MDVVGKVFNLEEKRSGNTNVTTIKVREGTGPKSRGHLIKDNGRDRESRSKESLETKTSVPDVC